MKKFKITSVAAFAGILLLCAVFSQAQSRNNPGTGHIIPSSTTFRDFKKIDTIRVILLVSDTTYKSGWSQAHLEIINGTPCSVQDRIKKTDHNCYWIYGFSVREFHYGNEMVNDGICIDCPDYWKHLYYLNDKKKPVKNTGLIIWQSVPVK